MIQKCFSAWGGVRVDGLEDHDPARAQRLPGLAELVVDLGRVSEPEKRSLLINANAHLSASAYEGFGLAPLEAAAAQ